MGRYDALNRDAAQQGYVDLRGVEARYGLPKTTAYRYLHAAGFVAHLPGMWVKQGVHLDHRTRCEIVHAYLGGVGLFTGATALHATGVLRTPPKTIELLRPAHGWRPVAGPYCIHYDHRFAELRSVCWPGTTMRLTLPARSIAEYSRHASVDDLCKACAAADRLRLSTLDETARELAARLRFPGRAGLREAVGRLRGELNHSDDERRARALLRAHGGLGEVPHRPMPVLDDRGVPIAEIDIPFFDVRYGVEVDGPPHLLPEVAAADRVRDGRLQRDGWEIRRFLWFQIDEDPTGFVREVANRVMQLRGV
jgi:hypothetical protein